MVPQARYSWTRHQCRLGGCGDREQTHTHSLWFPDDGLVESQAVKRIRVCSWKLHVIQSDYVAPTACVRAWLLATHQTMYSVKYLPKTLYGEICSEMCHVHKCA